MAGREKQNEHNTRIHLPPPPAKVPEDLSPDVWGFRDSGFHVGDTGEVEFQGDRYDISGATFPDLMPFARQVLAVDFEIHNAKTSGYPPDSSPKSIVAETFQSAITARLRPDQITGDPVIRLRHGHGMTQEEMWAIKHGGLARIPDWVVYPESTREVELIVDAASAGGVSLIPYGGGTSVSDALRCPEDESRSIVSVDLGRMNRVIWIDPENCLACIEAGATGAEINQQLSPHDFTMGHEPDSFELSTLGGWVATHASGMKKNRYGNIEDLVLGITAVTAAGTLERNQISARESVGGDPARWMLGSEGRLGIVTRCIVKVFPEPQLRRHGSVLFKSFEEGVAFLLDVERAGAKPSSIRLMDNLQFQFGQALKPAKQGVAVLKSAIEKAYVTRIKGFEVDRMVACTLLFEGSKSEVESLERRVYRLAANHGGMKAGGENGERGYQLTFVIAYIRDFMMENEILAESFETTVAWSDATALCQNVKQRIWQEHEKRGLPGTPFISCRVTQLYETGVCVYFYYAFHHGGVDEPSKVYSQLEHIAREEILSSGGSLSHHHGIGKLRRGFLPEIFSPAALRWRRELKASIDPDNLFGCGN